MAIQKGNPNTILLGGGLPGADGAATIDNEHIAGVAITPGMICEYYNDSNKLKIRPHASATEFVTPMVALEQIPFNKGINDAYTIGDLVILAHLRKGSTFYGIVPSGQNIQPGEPLMSNGDGKLKTANPTTAAGGVAQFQSMDNLGAVNADTRCRVLVV
jgi:hypothetical protein